MRMLPISNGWMAFGGVEMNWDNLLLIAGENCTGFVENNSVGGGNKFILY